MLKRALNDMFDDRFDEINKITWELQCDQQYIREHNHTDSQTSLANRVLTSAQRKKREKEDLDRMRKEREESARQREVTA